MRYEITIMDAGVQVWRDGKDVTESVNLSVQESDITGGAAPPSSISFDVPSHAELLAKASRLSCATTSLLLARTLLEQASCTVELEKARESYREAESRAKIM